MSKTPTAKRTKIKPRPAKPNMKTAKPRRTKPAVPPVVSTSEDAEVITAPTATDGAFGGAAAPAKRLSGLDAAAQVLREAGEPLNAQDLVKRMLDQGLWKTGGKTPASTIYAAIIREIKAKGSDARFQKVDRGRFAIAG